MKATRVEERERATGFAYDRERQMAAVRIGLMARGIGEEATNKYEIGEPHRGERLRAMVAMRAAKFVT